MASKCFLSSVAESNLASQSRHPNVHSIWYTRQMCSYKFTSVEYPLSRRSHCKVLLLTTAITCLFSALALDKSPGHCTHLRKYMAYVSWRFHQHFAVKAAAGDLSTALTASTRFSMGCSWRQSSGATSRLSRTSAW